MPRSKGGGVSKVGGVPKGGGVSKGGGVLKKRHDINLYDTVIFVRVGPEEVSFGIHKKPLCHYSSFFKAALTGTFKEATEGVIELPDEDPDVFRRFNLWLYTHVIEYEEENTHPDWTALFDLYVFAEKRGIPKLQNVVINKTIMFSKMLGCLPGPEIADAWENTSENSGLHRLLVDFYVYHRVDEPFDTAEKRGDFPGDFLVEVILKFYEVCVDRTVNRKFDPWKERCSYHIHEANHAPCHGPMLL